MMKKYIALYRNNAARDTQICKENPDTVSHLDDDVWEDCPDAQVYIGLFCAVNEEQAIESAAATEACDKNCICVIPIGDKEELNYLLKFAAGNEEPNNELAEKQLRALWTSYCVHERLDVDTELYQATLESLYKQLPGNHSSYSWTGYNGFAAYMGKYLI